MIDPGLVLQYLHKAIQWGFEHIDVELWLSDDLRRRLRKETVQVISSLHSMIFQAISNGRRLLLTTDSRAGTSSNIVIIDILWPLAQDKS